MLHPGLEQGYPTDTKIIMVISSIQSCNLLPKIKLTSASHTVILVGNTNKYRLTRIDRTEYEPRVQQRSDRW